jgi:hypothetical protein
MLAADPGLDLADLADLADFAAGALTGPSPARLGPAGQEKDRPVPAQLPGDVAAFTGRADELAELDHLLDRLAGHGEPGELGGLGGLGEPGAANEAGVVISVLSGTAGVGKTALAVRWARRAAGAFPDGQLYVNLRGYDPGQPVPPADALAGFLRALGLAGQDIPPGRMSAPPLTAACLTGGGCSWCSTTPRARSRCGRCCPAVRPAWWW